MSDRRSLPSFVVGARAAFVFLTRIPVGGSPFCAADWRWASAHHPLVGATVGVLLAGVWLAAAGLGPLAASALAVATGLLLTGALHEDGLADMADALGGGRSPDAVLAILKDPRIGSFGAAALGMSLLLRVLLLGALGGSAPAALIGVHCAARVPPVLLLAALPYVTPSAASKSGAAAESGLPQALVACTWAALVLALLVLIDRLTPGQAGGIAAAGALIAVTCARYYRARLGGVTGDLLGGTEQIGECIMLLVVAGIAARC